MTDLNTAQKELDDASGQYISQLSTFWGAYFELRKLSLYDFIHKKDILGEVKFVMWERQLAVTERKKKKL